MFDDNYMNTEVDNVVYRDAKTEIAARSTRGAFEGQYLRAVHAWYPIQLVMKMAKIHADLVNTNRWVVKDAQDAAAFLQRSTEEYGRKLTFDDLDWLARQANFDTPELVRKSASMINARFKGFDEATVMSMAENC